MQPTGLGIANLQRPKLANVKSADDANKVMKEVSKLLFDDKQKTNPLGRDMLLAQFYVFCRGVRRLGQARRHRVSGRQEPVRRPAQVRGLALHGHRERRAQVRITTLSWRNYKPYTDRIKAAYAAVGAGAADTAEKLATRAMILNHSGPQPYDVLWRVAKIRNDEAHEISYLQLAADKLEGDTLNGVVRSNFLFTLGRIQQEFGDAKTDKAAKDKLYRDAAKAYLVVLKEFPTSDEAPYAMQGISISAMVVGDTSISNRGGRGREGGAGEVHRPDAGASRRAFDGGGPYG